MVKIGLGRNITGQTPRVTGAFYIVPGPNGPVAIAWPRKRGKAKTPYDFYKQQEFKLAGRMAANAIAEDVLTAFEMAKGTQQVPRDIITMCVYGTYYTLVEEDGFEWPTFRSMAPNPQYMLDLINTDLGSMLYRADIGWIALLRGNDGQVITMEDGFPKWKNQPGAGTGGPLITTIKRTTNAPTTATSLWTCSFEAAEEDQNGAWNIANPTRMLIPATATHIRLSAQILFTGTAANTTNEMITRLNTGSVTWMGSIQAQLTRNNASASERKLSAMGPWVDKPTATYVELQWNNLTTFTGGFRAGTTFTMECKY